MSNLRLCDAPSDTEAAIPETYLFPGVGRRAEARQPRARVRPSITSDSTIRNVERSLDHAQDRLDNLRDLVDRFGLGMPGEGPRAA